MEQICGVVARSLIRHAVVGVLTGGVGNIIMLAGDVMDVHDTLDAMDAVSTLSDSSSVPDSHHDVLFGQGIYDYGTAPDGSTVAQGGTGPAYNTADNSITYGPNDVTWKH
jgi:hypothetical protein